MRRILRTGICLLGLAVGFAACGQGEGGRCQVNSDCASGLQCQGLANGNGRCAKNSTDGTADAAAVDDAADVAVADVAVADVAVADVAVAEAAVADVAVADVAVADVAVADAASVEVDATDSASLTEGGGADVVRMDGDIVGDTVDLGRID